DVDVVLVSPADVDCSGPALAAIERNSAAATSARSAGSRSSPAARNARNAAAAEVVALETVALSPSLTAAPPRGSLASLLVARRASLSSCKSDNSDHTAFVYAGA